MNIVNITKGFRHFPFLHKRREKVSSIEKNIPPPPKKKRKSKTKFIKNYIQHHKTVVRPTF